MGKIEDVHYPKYEGQPRGNEEEHHASGQSAHELRKEQGEIHLLLSLTISLQVWQQQSQLQDAMILGP